MWKQIGRLVGLVGLVGLVKGTQRLSGGKVALARPITVGDKLNEVVILGSEQWPQPEEQIKYSQC